MPLSVEDRMAILALVTRYNHAVDEGDVDTRSETFTVDGVWDSDTAGVVTTREAIRAHAATRAPQAHTKKHWTNSPVIEGDGDHATITQYLWLVEIVEPRRTLMIGTYHDTVRREPEGWLFAERKLRVHSRIDY